VFFLLLVVLEYGYLHLFNHVVSSDRVHVDKAVKEVKSQVEEQKTFLQSFGRVVIINDDILVVALIELS